MELNVEHEGYRSVANSIDFGDNVATVTLAGTLPPDWSHIRMWFTTTLPGDDNGCVISNEGKHYVLSLHRGAKSRVTESEWRQAVSELFEVQDLPVKKEELPMFTMTNFKFLPGEKHCEISLSSATKYVPGDSPLVLVSWLSDRLAKPLSYELGKDKLYVGYTGDDPTMTDAQWRLMVIRAFNALAEESGSMLTYDDASTMNIDANGGIMYIKDAGPEVTSSTDILQVPVLNIVFAKNGQHCTVNLVPRANTTSSDMDSLVSWFEEAIGDRPLGIYADGEVLHISNSGPVNSTDSSWRLFVMRTLNSIVNRSDARLTFAGELPSNIEPNGEIIKPQHPKPSSDEQGILPMETPLYAQPSPDKIDKPTDIGSANPIAGTPLEMIMKLLGGDASIEVSSTATTTLKVGGLDLSSLLNQM